MTRDSNAMEVQNLLSRPEALLKLVKSLLCKDQAEKVYRLETITSEVKLIDNVVIFLLLEGSDGPVYREVYVEVPEFAVGYDVSTIVQRILTMVTRSIKAVEE